MMSTQVLAFMNEFSRDTQSDILLFNASIANNTADELIQIVRKISARQNNVALILTTNGGDPNAAFRIARFLQRRYEKFTLFIFGHCKSAGTLIALGADEVVMSDFGELGPLDIQVSKNDDLVIRSSGLDIQQALNVLGSQAFTMFESYFLRLIEGGQGTITTKTAADIASSMAVNLLTPISGQIDPLRLGEMNRVMKIAEDYGERLSMRLGKNTLNDQRTNAIGRLTSQYPAHGFVIDFEEAQQLLGNVRECTDVEQQLENLILGVVRTQAIQGIVSLLGPTQIGGTEGDQDGNLTGQGSGQGTEETTVPADNGQGEATTQSLNSSIKSRRRTGE
jgi:Serine dehydrogenase proteinase